MSTERMDTALYPYLSVSTYAHAPVIHAHRPERSLAHPGKYFKKVSAVISFVVGKRQTELFGMENYYEGILAWVGPKPHGGKGGTGHRGWSPPGDATEPWGLGSQGSRPSGAICCLPQEVPGAHG